MNDGITPAQSQAPPAHPLAVALADELAGARAPRVLLLGIGSGRNVPPFAAIGATLAVVEDDPARAREAATAFAALPAFRIARCTYAGPYPFAGGFAAALSTHALLHGRIATIERAVASIAGRVVAGGALYATFGSTRDPRFAAGAPVEAFASAPREGSERGIIHAYFDEPRLRALLNAFSIEAMDEAPAGETAGAWAHDAREAQALRHWFVRARKR